MIVLAGTVEEELLQLKAKTLAFAMANQSTVIESEAWTFGSHAVRWQIKRRRVRSKTVLVSTLFMDGRRIGWNALIGKLNKGL